MSDEVAQSEKPWWRTWDGQPEWSARMVTEARFAPFGRRAGRWLFAAGLVLLSLHVAALATGHRQFGALLPAGILLANPGWQAMRGNGRNSWMPRWVFAAVAVGALVLNGLFLIFS